jgi:hypothetical protein
MVAEMTTVNDQQGPTWCEWVAAAIDVYPLAKRQMSERSAMIKRATEAMQSGNIADCNAILSSLVAKAGAASVPELPASKSATLPISKSDPDQGEEVLAARLLEKRDRLVRMRDQLHSMVERKATLAHRLSLIRNQLDARRNWQPLPTQEVNHERI